MSGGIKLQLNGQALDLPQNSEQSIEQNVQQLENLRRNRGENGAILFNLDWQLRQAEDRRQTLTTIFNATPAAPNQTENTTDSTWSSLVNLAREHEDFNEFRRQPESFWREVRQMSEPRIIKDGGTRETRTASRFDELLAQMRAKKSSPREFAKTLSPAERAVFKASYQLRQIFATDTFNNDGAAANEAEQIRFQEVSIDARRPAGLPEDGKVISKFLPSGDARAVIRGETTFGAKSAALPSAPQNFQAALPSSGNPALQNVAPANVPQTAIGGVIIANPSVPESFVSTPRGLTNTAPENAANNSATAQQQPLLRDGGAGIGGALINGAFAAIDNYKNPENIKIGDSRTAGDIYSAGGGLAAGAAGAMFGAAIGKVIPGAGTVVSGVLGFVSSVVAGVDVDRGLRWLSASEMTLDATAEGTNENNQTQITIGNSLTANSNLQTALA